MYEFMKILFSLSVSGTLLMLLILLPAPLYRKRFSRRWQYYIWLLAAMRFLMPFTQEVSVTGYLFERLEAVMVTESENHVTEPGNQVSDTVSNIRAEYGIAGVTGSGRYGIAGAAGSGIENIEKTIQNSDKFMNPAENRSDRITDNEENRNHFISYASNKGSGNCLPGGTIMVVYSLFCIWLAGALVLFFRKILIYRKFLSFLKSHSTLISDSRILGLLDECRRRQVVRQKVRLYASRQISSPLLTGFFRPCILVPSGIIPKGKSGSTAAEAAFVEKFSHADREMLSFVFIHELVHCKRGDMLYKWFIQVVCCIHWFNPFVYRLAKETGRACELACDEAVTAGLDRDGKVAYGNTLLSFLRTGQEHQGSPVFLTLTEGAQELKGRLGAIMKSRKKTKGMTLLMVLATTAFSLCFVTLGACAQTGSPAWPGDGPAALQGDTILEEASRDNTFPGKDFQDNAAQDNIYPENADGAGEEIDYITSEAGAAASAAVPVFEDAEDGVWERRYVEWREVVVKHAHQCTICGRKINLYAKVDVYSYYNAQKEIWRKKEQEEPSGALYSNHPCYQSADSANAIYHITY